jgi:microsomal epoxide hydrolase
MRQASIGKQNSTSSTGLCASVLEYLRRRLDTAGRPAELAESGWDYGTEQAFLRTVIDHWRTEYDWRTTEAELNTMGSQIATAHGHRIHLWHVRSADPDAIPLVLHVRPGSTAEAARRVTAAT